MARNLCVPCWLMLTVMLAGCALFQGDQNNGKPVQGANMTSTNVLRDDPLRIGDRVRVELSGIADSIQPSEQDINADGSINLTDIGSVVAAGKSPSQLQKEIEAKYVPAWYPHITVTVTPTARYFYVYGEVVNSGRILYAGPMTVMRAIGAAGHFTPFAGRGRIQVTRADGKTVEKVNGNQAIKHPEKDIPIYPGDSIFVPKRVF